MNFLDVKTDYAFKKVFGDEKYKGIVIHFLNSLIPFEHGAKIESLEILNPYNAAIIKGHKESYVDVKVRLSIQKEVLIEMQVYRIADFEKRVLYNTCHAYCRQLKEGDSYSKLTGVISLNLVDFELFKEFKEMLSHFQLLERTRNIKYKGEGIELLFVELPKFQKKEYELSSRMDKWLYFLRHAGHVQEVPTRLAEEAEIVEAFRILNASNLSDEEKEEYFRRVDFLRSNRNLAEDGRREGREEEKKQTVLNLNKEGMNTELIARVTGLDHASIESLLKAHNG